jgi:hypothetical protein
MNTSGALAGGTVGALLSSLIWIGIGYFTGCELGILAVGVGIACGIGVAVGAKGRAGTSGALIACACAILAIVAARYVLVQIDINQTIREAMADSGLDIPGPEDSGYWTSFIADRLIRQAERNGDVLEGPDDDSYDENDRSIHYPTAIWAQAQGQWNSIAPADRAEFCAAGTKSILANQVEDEEGFRGVASIIGVLISNFHPMALIIMAIAVSGAYGVAKNSTPRDESATDEFAVASAGESFSAPTAAPPQQPSSSSYGLPGMPPPTSTPGASGQPRNPLPG